MPTKRGSLVFTPYLSLSFFWQKIWQYRLETFFSPSSGTPDGDPAEGDRDGDGSGRVEPVSLDRVGCGSTGVVGDQSDGRRPGDPASCGPEQKTPPTHLGQAGDPGDGVAEDGDEATEEARLAAVALHQRLRAGEDAVCVAVQPAPAAGEGP